MNALIEVLYQHYFRFNSLPATTRDIMEKPIYEQTRYRMGNGEELPAYIIEETKRLERERKAREERITQQPTIEIQEPPKEAHKINEFK